MRRFLRNGLLFAAPFVIYGVLVVVVDPFDYFRFARIISSEEKAEISGRLHYTLWKSQQYAHGPKRRVLFGDSRMGHVDIADVEAIAGDGYFNFAFGGGTVPEMVDAYWFAAARGPLEEATFGVGFINFNARQNMNRFEEAVRVNDEPALYFVNRTVAHATGILLWDHFMGPTADLERPPMTREQFWQHQLSAGGVRVFGQFVYADTFERELERVVSHCREHDVRVRFVVPPTHADLQAKVHEFGLDAEQERFRAFLRGLAPTIDFDVPSELTRDASRFNDPFHPKMDGQIVAEVWGETRRYAEHSRPPGPVERSGP